MSQKDKQPNDDDVKNENNDTDNAEDSDDSDNKKSKRREALIRKLAANKDNNVVVQKLMSIVNYIWEKILSWRMLFLSFTAGAAIMGAAILVPIVSQIENLSQPVTLFETILTDLETAYVDQVDTNQLFETGINAMLQSLDPYTEYQPPQEALAMSESIDGKYGGVGLVIAGSPSAANAKSSSATPKEEAKSTISPDTTKTAPTTPSPAIDGSPQTKANPMDLDSSEDDIDGSSSIPSTTADASSSTTSSTEEEATTFFVDDKKNKAKDLDSDDEMYELNLDEDDDDYYDLAEQQRFNRRARQKGIRVVNAFEGYAFDYGMRVGDKLVAIDEHEVTAKTQVEQVRNLLRGEPGTLVSISFERDGVDGTQRITMPRSVVRLRDVKLATMIGNPQDGIGYIQLSGFAAEAGREMRNAIHYLQQQAEDASNGERSLQGLILDLRNNPGGLLTSAVDVSSLLVPKGSDIVSAKGRGFPGILYRSRVDPILDTDRTKLAVLVSPQTASAAEIVSGAIQDLDVGVIIGSDRTFGKGLVQNVEELPFNSALKFTVAKYYTPSGRCIQNVNYKIGSDGGAQDGGSSSNNKGYTATKIADQDRSNFYTKNGRIVQDGGGIEADYKVKAEKASALEVTLLRSGVFSDFAADWSKKNELTNNFQVDEDTYRNFQTFVAEKQKSGELKLDSLYGKPLQDLKKALKKSGYKGSEREVEVLQTSIVRDIQRDFDRHRREIKEDISQSILARYLPESMLIERGTKTDPQVQAATKLLLKKGGESSFDSMLARSTDDSSIDSALAATGSTMNVATSDRGFTSEAYSQKQPKLIYDRESSGVFKIEW